MMKDLLKNIGFDEIVEDLKYERECNGKKKN
jgi:uncharacterized caspase-like protein